MATRKPVTVSKPETKITPKASLKAASKAAPKTAAKTTTRATPAQASTVAKTPASVKTTNQNKPVSKPAAAKSSKAAQKHTVSAEQRNNYVEIAAFYIAERRGFAPGDLVADWLAAEAEIDQLIASGLLGKN